MNTDLAPHRIPLEPLTREGFKAYGDVLSAAGGKSFPTNGGDALRFHHLGVADCNADAGKTVLSIFRALRTGLPTQITMLERHPISSQAFVPLTGQRFVVIVAKVETRPDPIDLRAFLTDGHQGVNYHRATWHHPLVALDAGDFLVIDRNTLSHDFDQDYEEVNFMENIFVDPGNFETIPLNNSHMLSLE